MVSIFKLVVPGIVDSVIGFDGLPNDLLSGIRRGTLDGWPRFWRRWFENELHHDFEKNPKPFYTLDYTMINADKEKWEKIVSYVKREAREGFRLMDKIEAMALPLAPDSYSELAIEPEQIPIVPLTRVTIVPASAPVEQAVQEKPEIEQKKIIVTPPPAPHVPKLTKRNGRKRLNKRGQLDAVPHTAK